MRKLFSSRFTNGSIHFSLLLLRLVFGGMMLTHGWPKLMGFATKRHTWPDPLHVGSTASLSLTVFAEVFCSVFLIVGLLTRLAAIPLVICMAVIVFMVHGNDSLEVREKAILFLTAFVVLLFAGPGKVSIDSLIGR